MIDFNESSDRFRRLAEFTIERAQEAILWADSNARICRVNEAMCRALGYSRKELCEMSIADIDPDYQAEDWPRHWQELKSRKAMTFESQHRTRDGRIFPVEVSVNYIEFEGEAFSCSFARDISERKRLELEQRFSLSTIEASHDMIFWYDEEARVHRVNKAACRILGYSREELESMSIYDIAPLLTKEYWQEIWDQLRSKGRFHVDGTNRTKGGHLFPVDVFGYYLQFEGKDYAFSYVQDITERKKNDFIQRFSHHTIEASQDMIFWYDEEARVHRVNQAACDILGYSRETLEGFRIYDIAPKLTPEAWKESWSLLQNQGRFRLESVNRKKDGTLFPVEVSGYSIDFEGEKFAFSHVRDITERKEAEQAMKQLTVEKERFESELRFATQVQEGFLPQSPPRTQNFVFAAKTFPARFVGGDFFDFIPLPGRRLGIVLGDVSGKGVSAALYMARLLSDFRHLSQINPEPSLVMQAVNAVTHERSRQGMFATAVYLLLDPEARKLEVANAGHYPLLIKNGSVELSSFAPASSPPLGILPEIEIQCDAINLTSGDNVFAYTDGAIEPVNSEQEDFGIDRLRACLKSHQGDPESFILALKSELDQFTGQASPFDDLTLLAFKVE